LSLGEAPEHPHNAFRRSFAGGEPRPAPRFSRTPGEIAGPPVTIGEGGEAALRSRGISDERIAALKACGAM